MFGEGGGAGENRNWPEEIQVGSRGEKNSERERTDSTQKKKGKDFKRDRKPIVPETVPHISLRQKTNYK